MSTGTSLVNLNLVTELKDILTTEQIEKMNASVIRTMGIVGTSMSSRDAEVVSIEEISLKNPSLVFLRSVIERIEINESIGFLSWRLDIHRKVL